MTSLRKRLFVILIAATGFIWFVAGVSTTVWSRREIERALDMRLQEAARMVASLTATSQIAPTDAKAPIPLPGAATYQRQLACQIWSFDGRLVGQSSGAPGVKLSKRESGFSDSMIDGEPWRVYAIEDPVKGIRVLVGDRLGLRERLVADLIAGLLAPAIIVFPLLGLLIWTSLGRGLGPMTALAAKVGRRDVDDLERIEAGDAPVELRPLIDALNSLFGRLGKALKHERDVTAFAAHEMRTPLAGLKTHAQVALAAADPALRDASLQQILTSVDRATRLVRQLLDLARIDAGLDLNAAEEVNVGTLLDDIVESAKSTQAGRTVTVDPRLRAFVFSSNRELAILALRNLHENALVHTPRAGAVRWIACPDGRGFVVEDDGPGVADDELPLIVNRFFRGRLKSAAGSGLGLAIVDLAAKRMGATLRFINKAPGHGLIVAIEWPDRAPGA